jgi:hypothetical protein
MWSLLTGIIVMITAPAARNVTTKVFVLNVGSVSVSPNRVSIWLVRTLFNPSHTQFSLQNIRLLLLLQYRLPIKQSTFFSPHFRQVSF